MLIQAASRVLSAKICAAVSGKMAWPKYSVCSVPAKLGGRLGSSGGEVTGYANRSAPACVNFTKVPLPCIVSQPRSMASLMAVPYSAALPPRQFPARPVRFLATAKHPFDAVVQCSHHPNVSMHQRLTIFRGYDHRFTGRLPFRALLLGGRQLHDVRRGVL